MESTGDAAVGISATSASSEGGVATARPGLAQPDPSELTRAPLLLSLVCSLLSTAVVLFLGFSWSRYRAANPGGDSNFRIGTAQSVEITLVREDVRNLACSSNVRAKELRCGFDARHQGIQGLDEQRMLRPYNTVKGELLLVAGVWSALPPYDKLPRARFTVVCDLHVTSVLKSAALRWSPAGKFEPLDRTVPVGFVDRCEIPP